MLGVDGDGLVADPHEGVHGGVSGEWRRFEDEEVFFAVGAREDLRGVGDDLKGEAEESGVRSGDPEGVVEGCGGRGGAAGGGGVEDDGGLAGDGLFAEAGEAVGGELRASRSRPESMRRSWASLARAA